MRGIAFDRWGAAKSRRGRNQVAMLDLSEAPQAYKDIDLVMETQRDLVEPLVRLHPLAVVKG